MKDPTPATNAPQEDTAIWPRCAYCMATRPLRSDWVTQGSEHADGSNRVEHFCSLRCAGAYQALDSVHKAAENRRKGVPPEQSGALAGFLISALLTAGGALSGEPMPRSAAENLGLRNRERRQRDLKRRRRRNRRKRKR